MTCSVCLRGGLKPSAKGMCSGCCHRHLYGPGGPVDACPHCNAWAGSCSCVVCFCPDPLVDSLGECQSCHRKPAALLGVIGRAALLAAGARVVDEVAA